jgi:hypothetical protein
VRVRGVTRDLTREPILLDAVAELDALIVAVKEILAQ